MTVLVSFIAIIPLAKLLGFATEELSLRVGQTLAGLMNATLVCVSPLDAMISRAHCFLQGNAVELIVAASEGAVQCPRASF